MNHHLTYQANLTRIDDLRRHAAQQRRGHEAARGQRPGRLRRLPVLRVGLGVREPLSNS